MADQAETVDYEQRYKDLQAEFTRKSQALAELETAQKDGRLIDASQFANLATTNPGKAQEWAQHMGLDLSDRNVSGGEQGARRTAEPNDLSQFSDRDITDPQSPVYQQLLTQHGELGLRAETFRRYGPQILQASGMSAEFQALKGDLDQLKNVSAEQQRVLDEQARYLQATYHETQVLKDPRDRKSTRLNSSH